MKRNNLKTRNPKPADVDTLIESQVATIELDWEKQEEPIGIRGGNTITAHNLLEQINTTKDSSDYLWYTTRYNHVKICNLRKKFDREEQKTFAIVTTSGIWFIYK